MLDDFNDKMGINLVIKIEDGRFRLFLNEGETVNIEYGNIVDNIRFEMQGNMLIRDIYWSRFNSPF